jgi:hypothetical protein
MHLLYPARSCHLNLVIHDNLLSLSLTIQFIRFPFHIFYQLSHLHNRWKLTSSIIKLSLCRIDKPKENKTDGTHTDEKDEGHIGISICSFDNCRGDKWTYESRCSANCIEEGEEEVCFWGRNDFG